MNKKIGGGLLFLLLLMLSTACHKDNDNGISEEQMQQVMMNAQQVMANVSVFFEMADSVSDMSLHLDEIKAMENVEEAWLEDCSIGVKIKNGGVVTWNYINEDTTECDMDASLPDELGDNWAKGDYTIGLCEKKTACISISKVSYSKRTVNSIKKFLENNGYSVNIVKDNYFSPHFICYSMPAYGVNIILAHGGYNAETGIHRIISGVEYKEANYKEVFADWIDNGLEIACVKENKNGRETIVKYLAVTERLIKKEMTKKFPNNSLMFASVCCTLEGNDSLARFLVQKNLGCYLGYDGVVSPVRSDDVDLKKIMDYMLNGGYTVRSALAKVGSGANPQLKLIIPAKRDVALVLPQLTPGDWIDLNLPSGRLWASRNVGATSPEGYGDYFAWGETQPKSVYDWYTYRYGDADSYEWHMYGYFTKYCSNKYYGYNEYVDNLTVLQSIDDAASVNWGGGARTPTKDEWMELWQHTSQQSFSVNGVSGLRFIGSNGKSIFVPKPGYRSGDSLYCLGSIYYWTNTLRISSGMYGPDPSGAFVFNSTSYYIGDTMHSESARKNGLPVRAIR